jgi:hypothetical protein
MMMTLALYELHFACVQRCVIYADHCAAKLLM